MKNYDDIINLEHPNPKNHVRMPIEQRAAQFSPFSALSGYNELLKETRRIVDSNKELNDDKKEILDRTLKKIKNNDKVKIIYFIKDLKKDGGFYKTIVTNIKKVDFYNKLLITNEDKILLNNIKDIEIINNNMID